MSTKSKKSELERLEVYRLALTNVNSHPEIARQMTEIGYNAEVLDKGRKLYEKSLDAYHSWKKVWRQKAVAFKAFDNKWHALQEMYITHRNKAKVVFRKDEQSSAKLRLVNGLARRYIRLIDEIQHFYTEIAADELMKENLAKLNISADEINEAMSLLNEVLDFRASYVKLIGSAQNATQKKKRAYRACDDWMSDFFAVAKIAFKKDRQLLESLGKVVKS
jgi:hypothetical protein